MSASSRVPRDRRGFVERQLGAAAVSTKRPSPPRFSCFVLRVHSNCSQSQCRESDERRCSNDTRNMLHGLQLLMQVHTGPGDEPSMRSSIVGTLLHQHLLVLRLKLSVNLCSSRRLIAVVLSGRKRVRHCVLPLLPLSLTLLYGLLLCTVSKVTIVSAKELGQSDTIRLWVGELLT